MDTIQTKTTAPQGQGTETESGFQPIPTRIQDLAPLIVDKQPEVDPQVKSAVLSGLTDLSVNLAEVHRIAAEAYISQLEYDKAVPHLEAAATFGGSVENWNQLGFVNYLAGNDDQAIAAFEYVLSNEAQQPEALFNLGMVRFGKEDFEIAEQCFRAALEIQPNDAQGWNNRGVCLFQMGRADDAVACFQNALKVDPNDQDAVFNLQQAGQRG